MANDLATLRGKLDVQLSDSDNATWTQAEKNELITEAVANLYPRFARPFAYPIWPLTADRENYNAPTGMLEVYRIEVGEVATDLLVRVLDNGTWYTYDDPLTGSLKLFINGRYSDPDYYYIVHGVGRYDLATAANYIPDDLVSMVLATARAEAYRRVAGQRARFLQWQAKSHQQDVTVNELLALTQEAQADAERLRARLPRTARRPVPGRMSR